MHNYFTEHGPDSVTVLQCRNGILASTLIGWPRSSLHRIADNHLFEIHEHPVGNIGDVADLLAMLLLRQDCAVARGAILAGARRRNVEPKLRERPRRWVSIPVSGPLVAEASDLQACAAPALAELPMQFRDAASVVQAGQAHGFGGCDLNLWFWLSEALSGADLADWLDRPDEEFRADHSINVCAPVIGHSRVRDPVPDRLLVLPGCGEVAVPLASNLSIAA